MGFRQEGNKHLISTRVAKTRSTAGLGEFKFSRHDLLEGGTFKMGACRGEGTTTAAFMGQ